MSRKYIVIATNKQNNRVTIASQIDNPMNHHEACTFASKCNPSEYNHYSLREV